MEEWRIIEELERLHEWDPDAVCDALNITTSELLDHPVFIHRAVKWIRENNE